MPVQTHERILTFCCGAVIGWALYPGNPYGYYILMRWLLCPALSYLALQARRQSREGQMWILATLAAMFNPLVPLHLGREVWFWVDLLAILVLFSILLVNIKRPAVSRRAL